MVFIRYFFVLLIFSACQQKHRDFSQIQSSGVLKVLTLNTSTTYFEDRHAEMAGFEYELVNAFAKEHGLEAQFIVRDSIESLFHSLQNGDADFIAAGISMTELRQKRVIFSSSYQEVVQQLVCRRGVKPKKVTGLVPLSLAIIKDSSYEERLIKLQEKYPELNWHSLDNISSLEVFRLIEESQFDCTIVDSHIVAMNRRYYPELEVPMTLGQPQKLAWAINPQLHELQAAMGKWFALQGTKSKIKNLEDKYYGHTRQFDPYDVKVFIKRLEKRLPKFIDLFKKAGEQTGWPWKLLAAISYQESHWNPRAKSPTGVRGMMMLTLNTAKSVGVKNRLDAEQSIMGGAQYLKRLEKRIPSYIMGDDRLWMTLASYNVGYSHLRNARAVAIWRELNPNKWSDVRRALPLLSNKRYYVRLPHGYARGGEPVIFVDRIRHYYDLIERHLDDDS